jgi:hypothetical protein
VDGETTKVPMTSDEFVVAPDLPNGTQLIDGVVVTPDHAEGWRTRCAVVETAMRLSAHDRAHGGAGSMTLVHDRRALASHLVWTAAGSDRPSLIVGGRDTDLDSGVEEVWIVDGEADTVTVHRRGIEPVVCTETVTTPLVPGWVVDLAEVFEP